MVRQKKLTESFTEKKSSVSVRRDKLPTKRKLLSDVDENSASSRAVIGSAASASPQVQVGLDDSFQLAKRALHLSRPSQLPGREVQIDQVSGWLIDRLTRKDSGAMYISGAPGTGKTAVVLHSVRLCEETHLSSSKPSSSFFTLVVNCMSVVSSNSVYQDLAKLLKITKRVDRDCSVKDVVADRLLHTKSKLAKMIVLVLDEMDQLLQGKSHEVLSSLFEWATTPGSKLILIGIANALDLTVRHLPMLITSPGGAVSSPLGNTGTQSKPKKKEYDSGVTVMNFPPYERTDIEMILEKRLTEIGSLIFDPAAIKFVAAKVAASTGDMRKALNACKSALEAVEKQQRSVLKSTADDGFNFSSPKKYCMQGEKINVVAVAKVFGPQKDEGPLPLQQTIVLATVLKMHKNAPNSRTPKIDGVMAPIPLTAVYDEYRKLCAFKGFTWVDRSEISSVCSMLQDRSLLTVVENVAGTGATSKKFGAQGTKHKIGVTFEAKAVEKIVLQSDLKEFFV